MRKFLPAAAILAGAVLTLGACDTADDDVDAVVVDPATTLPADNSMIYTNDMMTNDIMTNDMDTNTVTNDVTP